jgi:hypothetical protein
VRNSHQAATRPIAWRSAPAAGEDEIMANIEANDARNPIEMARARARVAGHVERAQMMLFAAGLASLSIIAVAAAMMTTLF